MIDHPSPNFGQRSSGAKVDMIIVHYTGMESADGALARLCDPASEVSAHYMIAEDGAVCRLVAEDMRAWHAGVSIWAGATDINDRSIGIELVNPGHEFGYREFPESQMAALEGVTLDMVARHGIPAHRILGHSDVAPTRKSDPGELFDWRRLALNGIGVWSDENAHRGETDPRRAVHLLARYGYGVDDTDPTPAIIAFQRHFRPARIDGVMDPETFARLSDLCTRLGIT
jgi:N-acetylmuramoyl-L-alanine amidase